MGYKDPDRGAAAEKRRALNKEMNRRDGMAKKIERAESHVRSCEHCEEIEDIQDCANISKSQL